MKHQTLFESSDTKDFDLYDFIEGIFGALDLLQDYTVTIDEGIDKDICKGRDGKIAVLTFSDSFKVRRTNT